MSQSVELEPAEWQQVITALAMTHPVLVKISSQLADQQRQLHQGNSAADPNAIDIRGVPAGKL